MGCSGWCCNFNNFAIYPFNDILPLDIRNAQGVYIIW